jgi:hypothetical protein
MHHAASLVISFAFMFVSLGALTAPVAAQQSLPTEFVGRWEGTASHSFIDFSSPVIVDLAGGSVGAVVGTIDYPVGGNRSVACRSDLRLQSVAATRGQVTVVEDVTTPSACPLNGATVILTLRNDGRLGYDWRHAERAGDPFVGILTRTAACSWTGAWWSPVFGSLRLAQVGLSVSGDYDWDQGQIGGTVSGNTLGGRWSEAPSQPPDPADAGEFVFVMAADCQSFTGQWRYGSSGEWFTNWSGERVPS